MTDRPLPPPHHDQTWLPAPNMTAGCYRLDGIVYHSPGGWNVETMRSDWNQCNPCKIDWASIVTTGEAR
jgi:hypothetical protein